jgi:carboxypeptidase Taq
VDVQETHFAKIVEAVGFDLEAGRIDETAHPFCSEIAPGDVRLTTRYDAEWMPGGLFANIHEAGHGIYEQAFHRLNVPRTIASAPGLGMHESQSRMYENIVGRSREFWQAHYGDLQAAFPSALGDVDLDRFHRAINSAKRTLIRVEADELTYNMHVAVRFEIERALINGDMQVADLPDAWNAGMLKWVGIAPETNADGCLQDVHWSMGSFGYFPTYTLGNVYSSQFVREARKDIPDLDAQFAAGNVQGLIAWFDEHVYQHGCRYTGLEFVERISGGPLDTAPLIAYLRGKFGA